MPQVFTIYCCGTGSTREDKDNTASYHQGEIVSTMAAQNSGTEDLDWMILDGPGTARVYVMDVGLSKNPRVAMGQVMMDTLPGPVVQGVGMGTGYGMTDNVNRALERLRSLPSPKPKHINLIGWSRGAVTCFMLANAIGAESSLNGTKVRIFAVDPVAGGLDAQLDYWIGKNETRLPDCVEEFFGVYARDEVSRGFSPVIPRTDESTRVTYLPLPGAHGTVAGNIHMDKNSQVDAPFDASGPGKVTRFFAETNLMEWGVRMSHRSANYTDRDLCHMYDNMLANDAGFRDMQKYSYTKLRQGGWMPGNTFREVYIANSGWVSNSWTFDSMAKYHPKLQMMIKRTNRSGESRLFVNWHHFAVFLRSH